MQPGMSVHFTHLHISFNQPHLSLNTVCLPFPTNLAYGSKFVQFLHTSAIFPYNSHLPHNLPFSHTSLPFTLHFYDFPLHPSHFPYTSPIFPYTSSMISPTPLPSPATNRAGSAASVAAAAAGPGAPGRRRPPAAAGTAAESRSAAPPAAL